MNLTAAFVTSDRRPQLLAQFGGVLLSTISQGEKMPAPATRFAPASACPKCGNADETKFTTSFVRANQVEGKDYEYLDVTCNKCGYQREQLPLDAA